MKALHYFFAILSLCALASCFHDSMEDKYLEPDRYELEATIATDGQQTRTILLDNPGVRVQTRWAANDAICIRTSSGSLITMNVSQSDISNNGKTAIFRSTAAISNGDLAAFYPAQPEVAIAGDKVSATFPDTQHYTTVKGLPEPDPAVSLMAGIGTLMSGVAFCNVMAVLKIGQAFDEPTNIKAVEFRDLSGKAVAGRIDIGLSDNYKSQVAGGSTILTLDCGDGVSLEPNVTGVFYIIVPARDYPNGVEITFVTDTGERMSRTAGVSNGVTFNRGVIYPIGEIANRDYLAKDAAVLADNAYLMTPEILRQMTIISASDESVINDDGSPVLYNDVPITAPAYSIMVPSSLGFKKGDYLVFDATDDLPSGGVFQITDDPITPYADETHSRIEIHLTSDFANAYKSVNFGGEMFDAAGNLIEGAGQELDLSSYLSEIRDAEGNEIQYSVSESGEILLSQEALESALTKAIIKGNKSVTSPKLSVTFTNKAQTIEVTVGASVTIGMKCGIKLEEGEVEFVHFMVNPKINLSANFALKGSASESKEFKLITLYFIPGIPIAPGVVLTPELELRASVGIGGEIVFSASLGYTYDMGQYGLSYLRDQGFSFHHFESEPSENPGFHPDLGGALAGSLYAQGTITAIPTISLFRVFRAGLYIDFSLKFGLQLGSEFINNMPYTANKLFLTPELAFSPYVATLGGHFTKKWKDVIPKIEFDPIWERYLHPVIDWSSTFELKPKGVFPITYKYKDAMGFYHIEYIGEDYFKTPGQGMPILPYKIDEMDYKVKSLKPTLDDWVVYMDIMSGSTNRSWSDMALSVWDWNLPFNYNYTGSDRIARYELLQVPAAQDDDDDISAKGNLTLFVEENYDIPQGQVRSCHMVCENKRTGAIYEYKTVGPFEFYWPTTPSGPWFKREGVPEFSYEGVPDWPSQYPLPF